MPDRPPKRTNTEHIPGLRNPLIDPDSTPSERLLYQQPRFDRQAVPWSAQIRYALDHPEEFPPIQPGEAPNPVFDGYELRRLAHDTEAGEAEWRTAREREGRQPPESDRAEQATHTARDREIAARLGVPVTDVAAVRAANDGPLTPTRIAQILQESA